MSSDVSRRKTMGAAAFAPAALGVAARRAWPLVEGPDTPKICLGSNVQDEAAIRSLKQIGVDRVLTGGGPILGTRPTSARGSSV